MPAKKLTASTFKAMTADEQIACIGRLIAIDEAVMNNKIVDDVIKYVDDRVLFAAVFD